MSVRTENYAFALIVSVLLCLPNVGCMSNGLTKSRGFGWLGGEKAPNLTRDPSFPPPSSIGTAQTASQLKRSNPLANAAKAAGSQTRGLASNATASGTPPGYALPNNAPANSGSHSRGTPPANNMVQTGLYDVPVVPETGGQIAATPPQNFASTSPTSPAPSTNMYTGAAAIPLPKPGTVAQNPSGGGSTRSIYEMELDGTSGAGALMSHSAPIEPPPIQNALVKPLETIQPLATIPSQPAAPVQPVEPIAPPVTPVPQVATTNSPPPPTLLNEPPTPPTTETATPPAPTFYQSRARQATAWRPGSTSDLKTL